MSKNISKYFNWSLIVATNDSNILNNNILLSPALDKHCDVIIKHGYSTIPKAYNEGISEANNDILVFAHQDIYFPTEWLDNLFCELRELEGIDPNWGVLGVYGVRPDMNNDGYVYCNGQKRILGHPFHIPIRTNSLDEIVLIIKKSSGLFFDENLPGFHFYGTDICLEAMLKGMNNYIIPTFCIHSTKKIIVFPFNFWKCYFFMKKKWKKYLPLKTTCVTINKYNTRVLKPLLITFLFSPFIKSPDSIPRKNPKELYDAIKNEYPYYFNI